MKKLLLLFASLTLLTQIQLGAGTKKVKSKKEIYVKVYLVDTLGFRTDTISWSNGVKVTKKGKDIRNPVPPIK